MIIMFIIEARIKNVIPVIKVKSHFILFLSKKKKRS